MTVRSTDANDYQDVPRPVAAMPKEFPAGFVIAPHSHKRSQLTFAAAGVMVVTAAAGIWVVPPHRAVWIPGGTEHSLRMVSAVSMRALYIEPDTAHHLPATACVIDVSRLLRELILESMSFPVEYDEAGRDGRIIALILDEIRALPALPLHLPLPRDPRLARLCDRLAADPASERTLDAWSHEAGASPRNLERLFRRETGMSFGAWRRQARLLAALSRLAEGAPVTNIALDLGYDSPSAFTAMFRRQLGIAPSRYFAPV